MTSLKCLLDFVRGGRMAMAIAMVRGGEKETKRKIRSHFYSLCPNRWEFFFGLFGSVVVNFITLCKTPPSRKS